jgi:hypothetical protein
MYREISHCIAQSTNIVDVNFLKKGLHDIGQKEMSTALQDEINNVPKDTYDAILLGYGLCNNGIKGLTTEYNRLVVPRAHDCITLLLGSKEKYMDYVDKNPGTYFRSTGWIERNTPILEEDGKPRSTMTQLGFNRTLEELIEKYGEDNGRYIMETMESWQGPNNYDTLGYIDMDIGNFDRYEEQSRQEACDKGWSFKRLQGDTSLLQRLVDGDWNNDEFLIVEPGQRIEPVYLGEIIKVEDIV